MSTSHRQVLLMICYKFPPMHSVSCKRTWGLHQEFKKHFSEVFVISTSNRHILPRSSVSTGEARITDARTNDYRTVLQGGKEKHASASESVKQSLIGKTAIRLQASFPTLYWFGEGGRSYIRNALRHARSIVRESGVTHVFSTFPPYADHLIAHRLKKEFPHLVWIADFRDLHVDPTQNNLFFRHYQRRRNRDILRSADLVLTVSKGLAKHLAQLHPRVRVLYNGMNGTSKPLPLYSRFTIAYSGSMFQDKRRPDRLLEALSASIAEGNIKMDDLALIYAGKDGEVWVSNIHKYGLDAIFEDRGLISQEEARTLQQSAHLNLLLTYSSSQLTGNLTGKLFDYLEAGRPIIVIVNGPHDEEINALIGGANAGFVCSDDTPQADLRAYVETMYRVWRDTKTLKSGYNNAFLERFGWSRQVQELVQDLGIKNKQHALS